MKKKTAASEFLAALVLSASVLTLPVGVHAQVNPEIANCSELKDEALIATFELCKAHTGCRYVLNVQKTCARAKGYLERLQAAIGEGTKTLFGYRKEVTPDAVFTAALGADELEKQRQLAGNTRAQQRAQQIGAQVREVGRGDEYSGRFGNGSAYIYYGQVKDGVPDGIGTRIASNGEIQRGQFDGNLYGSAEILFPNGTRFVGDQRSNERTGFEVTKEGRVDDGTYNSSTDTFTGSRTYPDGTRFQGRFDKSQRTEGKFYRADGSLAEEGKYQNGQLFIGTKYDTAGMRAEVNLPREREIAAQAEQQRKRDISAQAEQQFQASLQTMNPGQLFAKADELNAQGDRARAREVQRALMSRFPDHQLAAATARQMTGESGGSPASAGTARAGGRSGASAAASEVSLADCVPQRDAFIAFSRKQGLTEEHVKKEVASTVADVKGDRERSLKYIESYQRAVREYGKDGSFAPADYAICLHKLWLSRLSTSPSVAGDTSGATISSAASARSSASGRLSSQACAAMRQTVATTRMPPNASVTASLETTMFLTKTAMDMITGGCQADGAMPEQFESQRQAYAAAESACNQVQSGGRRCVPQAHTTVETMQRPSVTSAASGAQQSKGTGVWYDPRRGCMPEDSCECRQTCGVPRSSSGGGGIRTAR